MLSNQTIPTIISNTALFCRSTQVPCISPNTEHFLEKLLYEVKPKRILEIGTAYGYSLAFMAHIIDQWGGVIIGSERAYPNRVQIKTLLALINQYGLHNAKCLYGSFLQLQPLSFLKAFDQQIPFDFVFVDAQKSEYPEYIDYLITYNLVDHNTTLVFDDTIKYQERMSGLVEKLEYHGFSHQIHQLDEDDGIIVAQCKNQ